MFGTWLAKEVGAYAPSENVEIAHSETREAVFHPWIVHVIQLYVSSILEIIYDKKSFVLAMFLGDSEMFFNCPLVDSEYCKSGVLGLGHQVPHQNQSPNHHIASNLTFSPDI